MVFSTLIRIQSAPHGSLDTLKQGVYRLLAHDYYLCSVEWFAPFSRTFLLLQEK